MYKRKHKIINNEVLKVCNYYDCLKVVYGTATGLKFFEWSPLLSVLFGDATDFESPLFL